jgi:uncharacterized beta-barrel protein YwiB (DUF1934 family)
MAESKGVPILISLEAQSTADERPEDAIRLITTGKLFERDEETVIKYEESLDEKEPPQKIELTVHGEEITMSRQGTLDAKMVFSKGHRYETQYHTPYGDIDMALYCIQAACKRSNDGGELSLRYQLDLGGQYAAMHDMKLHWRRKKAD